MSFKSRRPTYTSKTYQPPIELAGSGLNLEESSDPALKAAYVTANKLSQRATSIDEEIKRDPRVTWIVAFYAAWSPNCINLAPIFSKLSAEYGLPNLKFGKVAEFIQ